MRLGLGLGLSAPRSVAIANRLLLNKFSGAAFAMSTRLLDYNYRNNYLFQVRRDNDNDEAQVLADMSVSDPEITLDSPLIGSSATFGDFVGANNGLVAIGADQSGNDNHATQTTAASQPKIVDAGTLVTENGKPALDFDGVDDGVLSSAISASFDNASMFVVSKNDTNSGNKNMMRIRPNGSAGTSDGIVWEQGLNSSTTRYSTNTMIDANGNNIHPGPGGVGIQDINQHLNVLLFNQSEILSYEDGVNDFTHDAVLTGSAPVGTVTINQPLWIGRNFDSNNREFGGKFQEAIIYLNDQSSNRTSIEQNINDYFGVY